MSAEQAVMGLLQNKWTPSRPERQVDVPEPLFVLLTGEKMLENIEMRDYVKVSDGSETIDAGNIGWNVNEVDATVSIDLYTQAKNRVTDDYDPSNAVGDPGITRLRGFVDTTNTQNGVPQRDDPEVLLGGLEGEVKKIINDQRKGFFGYDIARISEFRNLSDENLKYYRGNITVGMNELARDIQ
jgi:hypothetical protein